MCATVLLNQTKNFFLFILNSNVFCSLNDNAYTMSMKTLLPVMFRAANKVTKSGLKNGEATPLDGGFILCLKEGMQKCK